MIRLGREGKHVSTLIPPKPPTPDRASHAMRAIVGREYGTPDVGKFNARDDQRYPNMGGNAITTIAAQAGYTGR